MAAKNEQTVKVFHPAGFPVEVSKSRAEQLKRRGYTATKPKPAKDEPTEK